jgi:hypothetical protein
MSNKKCMEMDGNKYSLESFTGAIERTLFVFLTPLAMGTKKWSMLDISAFDFYVVIARIRHPEGNRQGIKASKTLSLFYSSSQQLTTATTQPKQPFLPFKSSFPSQNTFPIMSLFKSTKNQSASAAASPAQTPRPSVDAQRPAAQTTKKMTTEQALDSILHKAVQTMPSISTVM